jgi:hypothetical protein
MKSLFLASLMFLAPLAANAQTADARWTPWLGCWKLQDESVRQPLPYAAAALGAASARVGRQADGVRVCVAPTADATGVTLTTTVDEQSALEQTIVADAMPHPVTESDCRGTQRAEWSAAGARLYARAEVTCGDQTSRKVSGLSMITNGIWTDVQSVEVGGRENIRVRRYQRASAPAASASVAPQLGATEFTIADVKEAVTKISPRAVEAALVELGTTFTLNGRALLDLDRAGVPDSVIDLMVAVSYPDHFVVRPRENAVSTFATAYDPWTLSALPYLPYFSSALYPYDSLYSFYGAYSPYYYSPFGYSYWAGYSGGYYPGFVTVDPGQVEPAATGSGRAINGVGYTRITRPAAVATRDGGASADSGGSSAPRGDGGSSGGSGGSVSPSGFSGGGSSGGGGGDSGGRTAVPR